MGDIKQGSLPKFIHMSFPGFKLAITVLVSRDNLKEF